MLWIRMGFNADPDPAFHLNAVPDRTLKSQKVEFLHGKHIAGRYFSQHKSIQGREVVLRYSVSPSSIVPEPAQHP